MTRIGLVLAAVWLLILSGGGPAQAAEVASGRPGESFTISLEGALPGRTVQAELAGAESQATATRSGRARIEITVPEVAAGDYTLHVTGGLVRDVGFRVLESPGGAGATAAPATAAAAGAHVPVGPASAYPTSWSPDPVGLTVGGGLVLAGSTALVVIGLYARRRRRFRPVGY